MSVILMQGDLAPATPEPGKVALYPKTDGVFYYKSDDGVEHAIVNQYGGIGVSFEATQKPAANGIYSYIMPYGLTVSDCSFYNATNPSAEVVVSVTQNGTEFATLTVTSGGVATWDSEESELAAGDRVSFVFPASQDSTWAGVVLTLRGVRV